MKKQKGLAIEIIITVLLLAFALGVVFFFRSDLKGKDDAKLVGIKKIEVTVLNETEKYNKKYSFETKEKILGDLLDNKKMIEYSNGDYGKFIIAVDGMKADDAKEQWWNVEVNGVAADTGIDQIEIKNGDKYTLSMKTGY